MQPIWNPAQSLMQGIGMAQRIRESLQRQQMEERQLKLAEEEQQRARQVRNIQLLGEIVRNARPVSQDGKVTESTTMDMKVQGVPDFVQQPKPLTVTNEREADPGRTFGFEGNRYEFLSPSDQEARDVERSRLVSEHQNASLLNRLRGELAVRDPYEQKDRDFRAQLQQEQLDAQGMIELARQRAADERAQQAHRWQMMIEQNRQKYQSGEKAMDRQATLEAARARAAGSAARSGDARAVGVENTLRDDFRQQTGDFQKTARAYQRLLAASKGGDGSGVGDLAFIYSYMKMLDPGSTVMQGEAANAQNSAGLPDSIRTLYNRTLRGDKLSPNQRELMLSNAGRMYSNAKQEYDGLVRSFTKAAESRGAIPSNVVMDLGLPEVPNAAGGAGIPKVGEMFNGEKVLSIKRIK